MTHTSTTRVRRIHAGRVLILAILLVGTLMALFMLIQAQDLVPVPLRVLTTLGVVVGGWLIVLVVALGLALEQQTVTPQNRHNHSDLRRHLSYTIVARSRHDNKIHYRTGIFRSEAPLAEVREDVAALAVTHFPLAYYEDVTYSVVVHML